MNQWLLSLLATIAFVLSSIQQVQQQDWLALGSVVVAWVVVLWLIWRHRQRGEAILGAELQSLQQRLQIDAQHLRIDQDCWPLDHIQRIEMGIIDQQRAYIYFTIDTTTPDAPAQVHTLVRKYLIPYQEYDSLQQQLMPALPHTQWLLPQQ
jgi:ABC-type nickel/cobalt efflux system permease component RcnA